MRAILNACIAASFLGFSPASAETFDPLLDADPFAAETLLAHPPKSVSLRHYLAGVSEAGRLETDAAQRDLRAAWSTPDAKPELAWHALSLAGTVLLRAGHYREAGDLLDRAISEYRNVMPAHSLVEAEQARGIAMALRNEPPQQLEHVSAGTIPLSTDALGLTAAACEIDHHAEAAAVIDTGANFSTLSATAARALGVLMLTRKISVASSTIKSLGSMVAVAETVSLGPALLHNVVFIVLDDAALSPLGPDKRIDVILGYPVLAALGRITFGEDEVAPSHPRSLTIEASKKAATPGNLRIDGFDPYVRLVANGEPITFFVDGGANKTAFEKRYAREHRNGLAHLQHKRIKVAGAGAIEERNEAIIPTVQLRIGNKTVSLANVAVELDGNGNDTKVATLGADALWAMGGYTIEFGALNLSVGGE